MKEMKEMKDWNHEITSYQQIAGEVLRKASNLRVTDAEVHIMQSKGLVTTVRQQEVEALQYQTEQLAVITVYLNGQKGDASTTDLSMGVLDKTLAAAVRIATLMEPDKANGLPDSTDLASDYPDLGLHHSFGLTALEVMEKAKACEAYALESDKRIMSDGVEVSTSESMSLLANTRGFMGSYLKSRHSIDCTLLAKDEAGRMQRDGSYTINRNPQYLRDIQALAKSAAFKTVRRLGARRIKTCQTPVIFEANVADSLISCFLSAISGAALYRKASFLLDKCGQLIFPPAFTIEEFPYELGGLGSAPFDDEGVSPKTRYLVKDGVLNGYLLSSYTARRLGLKTTGNAGGYYNIKLSVHESSLDSLLTSMGKGLLVTEILGHGVNLVTGDYSQGVSGFWVENGAIQYPVEELTVAGNLRDMYQSIIAVAGDINRNSRIQTGSLLIERMTVAGE